MTSSGRALVLSSAITSALGLGYWVIAARNYDTADVGIASAMVSSMVFIANTATIGLKNGLVRFVPVAGMGTRRLIAFAYLVSATLGLAGAALFLTGASLWAPDLVDRPWWVSVGFVAACVLWVLFVLQDSVLIGLHRATWIPVENAVFAVAKIVLLFVLASQLPAWGVFVSWVLPVVGIVAVMNIAIARVAENRPRADGADLSLHVVAQFAGGDFLASLTWLAAVNLLPLLVLARLGDEASAYYYVSFTFMYALFLVSSNFGSAVMAAAAADPVRLTNHLRVAARQSTMLIVPAALGLFVLAPWVLRILGSDYEREATTTVRIMALAALAQIPISLAVTRLRARREVGAVLVLYMVLVGILVTLSWFLADPMGIEGIAIAWLTAQTLVGAYVLVFHLDALWLGPVADRAMRAGRRVRSRRRRTDHTEAVEAALPRLDVSIRLRLDSEPWEPMAVVNESAVVAIGAAASRSILRLPLTPAAEHSLRRHVATCMGFADDATIADWSTLVPRIEHAHLGADAGSYSVETYMPGINAREALSAGIIEPTALVSIARAVAPLHSSGGPPRPIAAADLDHVVDRRIAILATVVGRRQADLDELRRRLRTGLEGAVLEVGTVHGDFCTGNVLVDPATANVTGIVDWECSSTGELTMIDHGHLWLTHIAESRGAELGQVVLDQLLGTTRMPLPAWIDAGGVADDVIVLLSWLHHVTANLDKAAGYASRRIWLARNVVSVLDAVGAPATG